MRRRTTRRSGADAAAAAIVAAVLTIGLAGPAEAAAPAPTSSEAASSTYTVAKGDTLSAIALRTGVTASAIASANSLASADRLQVGMRLRIPRPSKTSKPQAASPAKAKTTAAATAKSKSRSLRPGRYVVKSGDNVISLARRAGIAPRAIIAANGLAAPGYMIRAGAALTIPSGSSASATDAARRSGGPGASAARQTRGGPVAGSGYRVRRGDTVIGIASRAGVSAGAIIAANRLAPPTFMIRDGQTLQIPKKGAATAAPGREARPPAPGATNGSGRYPNRGQVGAALDANARRYGLPPDLVKGLAWQESGWRQESVSSVGAVGVMQLMPGTADWIGNRLLRRKIDSRNYQDNIQGGTAYLDHLLGQVGQDERLALASYYQGLGSVRKRGLLKESERYVSSVQANRKKFR